MASPFSRIAGSLCRLHFGALGLACWACLALAGCSPDWYGPDRTSTPNILLILADDMGYGDVGLHGNPYLTTPNLDALARSGVRFENFYVSPVCAPTRASLLTGRYHQRTGVRSVTNGFEIMHPDEVTLAEMLREHGYRTAIYGKWHVGEYYPSLPNAQGFDDYLGFRTGHTADYYDAELERNGKPFQTRGHITDALTRHALDFMLARDDRPFFCYLAYNAPHTPLQVDSSYFLPYLAQGVDERVARVYGLVKQIDDNVGALMSSLRSFNMLNETIIIFLSDNGPISGWRIPQEEMRYNAGLRDQKFTVYEGGIRSPAYWMWQDHWPAGKQVQSVAGHIDLLPTLLEVCGIPLQDSLAVDGLSLLPILDQAPNDPLTDRIFFQKYALETLREPAPFPGGMARQGNWKMVDSTELYNLAEDPGERQNLASQYPERLDQLRAAYLSWYQDVMAENRRKTQPIGLGYAEENPVALQPHHGRAAGGVQFTGRRGLEGERIGTHPQGVDGDWLASWRRAGDGISWSLDIVEPGTYTLAFKASGTDTPASISLRLSWGDQNLPINLTARQLGADWSVLPVESIQLEQGPLDLSVTLTKDLPTNDFALRAVLVERVEMQ